MQVASAQSESMTTDEPAEPLVRAIPEFPSRCMPEDTGAKPSPEYVIVRFDLTREGETRNVAIVASTNACFDETALAAVRGWRYKPRRINGKSVVQEGLETSFTFRLEEETEERTTDAQPLVRALPKYPTGCMGGAGRRETVFLEFDVTSTGQTTNIRVIDTTHKCLNRPSMRAVEKWRYAPKLVDGEPVARAGVQVAITFELSDARGEPELRQVVARRFIRVRRLLRKDGGVDEALEILSKTEERYGDTFTKKELSYFHRLRGLARLKKEDYRGALDDFRIARAHGGGDESLDKAIAQLEARLGLGPELVDEPEEASDEPVEGAAP